MRQFLVFTLCFISLHLFSQNDENRLSFYMHNFQYQKALEYISTQEPTKALLLQKVVCYKALNTYKEAIAVLEPLAAEYPQDIQIRSELAICYEAVGKKQSGIDSYDMLISMDSTNAYFKLQKADLLYQQGAYGKALTLYKSIYDDHGLANTITRSAQCFEKMNKPDSAIHYYSMALEIDSTDVNATANLINITLKRNNYLNAMVLSDNYISKDSTDKQINLLNALSYYGADLYEEAVTRFEKCRADGDSSLIVNRSLGIAYYSLNDSGRAMPLLEAAFEQDTLNNNVLYCLAMTYNDMAEYKKAIPYFNKLLDRTIPPDLTLYLYHRNLGLAYSKSSDYRKAADTYIKALEYAGDNQKMNLYYMIGQVYENALDDNVKAIEYYKLYKASLNAYLGRLKAKPETEEKEIRETTFTIRNLNLHLSNLSKETGIDVFASDSIAQNSSDSVNNNH